MSQLDSEHRSSEDVHEKLEEVLSKLAEGEATAKETGNSHNYWYSEEAKALRDEANKLRNELTYVREKEFLESLKTGDKITVLGNPRNGYRPTRLLAMYNEPMRIDGTGALDIVELEITERDTTENNSGVIGKNVHGKKMMKGVLVPRPQFVNHSAVDPVYFYWLSSK